MKTVFVVILGILAVVYLIYPSAGVFELIPDFVPFIGSLDEAAATALLISVLGYFGVDVSGLFKRDKKEKGVEKDSKKEL